MKLKFDSNLEHQKDAIEAVTDLFEGMPAEQDGFTIPLTSESVFGQEHSELGVGNSLILPEEQLLKNLRAVQTRNGIPKSKNVIEPGEYKFPNFSVEMETGTGKTYVYLRTIFDLNKLYGFKKFIIVVPSVAIREGVTSSLKGMRDHFRGLYGNTAFDSFVYNSKDLSRVRSFAVNNEIQIMIINIQAFQKDAGDIEDYSSLTEQQRKKLNVIHQEQDRMSGRRPIEFIRATNPVVIIDEPQSVDTTEKSKSAIAGLNPLFCLRYSATHTQPYNLLYQLDPVRAFDMKLVKQIEVVDASPSQDFNRTMVRLDWIGYPGKAKTPQAKVTVFEDTTLGPREKQLKIKHGADLSLLTNREDYEGYQVTNISAEPGNEYIEFGNGEIIQVAEEAGGMADERMKNQLRQTIEEHFSKERRFKGHGIKVLSLFFLDHVGHYRTYDEDGNSEKGKVAIWFEELYKEISGKSIYKGLIPYSADEVHDGYFSADLKQGKVVALLDTSGGTAKDDETYRLIMQDKERLLDAAVPLRFIFSHSALKEGWDNPNVFQICTLRDFGSERERRQTLGRGLRLPVNSDGDRVMDEQINRLTVIANESFQEYAKGLQSDIERSIDPSGNFKFGRLPKHAFIQVLHPDETTFISQEESEELWHHIRANGYIDTLGDFTATFTPDVATFTLDLPAMFVTIEEAIIARMKRFLPREFVKDGRKRERVKYDKRVELNPEFITLWEKIRQKTQYSVEFKTEELITRAVEKIKKMPKTEVVMIKVTKRELEVTEAGLTGGRVEVNRTYIVENTQPLPDILGFLQRETELTRGTLVKILKESERLKDFALNPQAFMTETAKLIGRALHELIVDGIKYEPIAGQVYEMKLFEEAEVEEYLSRLYAVGHPIETMQDGTELLRTPYDHVIYDSGVEHDVARGLDQDERVRFFCKLPRSFKVPTPLGTYNPDWAIVLEEDRKLYLVRETKSTLDHDKRRDTENKKVQCGKAHFDAIGVNFKEATDIFSVLSE